MWGTSYVVIFSTDVLESREMWVSLITTDYDCFTLVLAAPAIASTLKQLFFDLSLVQVQMVHREWWVQGSQNPCSMHAHCCQQCVVI